MIKDDSYCLGCLKSFLYSSLILALQPSQFAQALLACPCGMFIQILSMAKLCIKDQGKMFKKFLILFSYTGSATKSVCPSPIGLSMRYVYPNPKLCIRSGKDRRSVYLISILI